MKSKSACETTIIIETGLDTEHEQDTPVGNWLAPAALAGPCLLRAFAAFIGHIPSCM
ncbi:MAG TPA: hypothetical protein VJW77_14760 [Terriglobia bacterium]|nr:hypothetical protein [Terriglobia bacterium]